jgi:phage gp36-like protein
VAYSDYDDVRAVHKALANVTDFPDAILTTIIATFADPEIDAYLKAQGFTVPFSSTPAVITVVSSMLAAAHALRTRTRSPYGEDDAVAGQIENRARITLQRIATGDLDIGQTRDSDGYAIAIDQSPDTRPATQGIVSTDETQWEHTGEERA